MGKPGGLRCFYILIITFFMTLGMTCTPLQAAEGVTLDILGTPQGTVSLKYSLAETKKCKVMVQKGEKKQYYDLIGNTGSETFPLQMGKGTYTVAVLENVTGNRYRYVAKETVALEQEDATNPYLQSVQMIKWEAGDPAIKKAHELVQGKDTDAEKLEAVYSYLVNNFKYDYAKLGRLASGYLPDINATYKMKTGICYDFSSLFAAMLRSVEVPAKLVKGYGEGIQGYHAWNEVYIDGKWQLVDTSHDIQMREYAQTCAMYKDSRQYNKGSEF